MRSVRHGQKPSFQASSGPPTALELVLGAAIALLMLDRDRHRPAPIAGGNRTDDTARSSGKEAPGRDADSPAVIPARGWLEVLRRVWAEIGKDNISIIAAGCAFYALLALFPAISALVAIYGIVADPSMIEQQIGALGGVVPKEALDLLNTQAHAVAAAGPTRLSWGAGLSLLIALYSATSGVKTLFEALNIAYEEEETRSFLRLNINAFGFTLVAVIGVAAAISVIVGLPVLLAYLPLGPLAEWLARIGFWILLVAMLLCGLALLYRFGPSSGAGELALGKPRLADRSRALAGVVRRLLAVCRQVRHLQSDLWHAGRRGDPADVALHQRVRHPARCRAQR